MYLIERTRPDGNPEYVNVPGSERSYTSNPVRAQRFPSLEAAQTHCCSNERPVKRSQVLEY
jgi:hypothetical protein